MGFSLSKGIISPIRKLLVGDNSGASGNIDQALSMWDKIKQPTPEEMQVQLQQLVQQGIITPEDAQAALVDHSAYNDINMPTVGRDAQLAALGELKNIYSQGGLNAEDRARILDIQDQINATNRGNQLAIGQKMQQQGQYGSGADIAQRLLASQGAATDANRQGIDVASLASKRALDAITQSANIGSNLTGQDWQQAQAKAEANDIINRFNAGNTQQVNLANVAARNAAQSQNLAEKQRVADYNATMENENRLRNSNLKQNAFNNAVTVAQGKSGLYGSKADLANQQYMGDVGLLSGLLQAGGQMAAGGQSGQQNKKQQMATSLMAAG